MTHFSPPHYVTSVILPLVLLGTRLKQHCVLSPTLSSNVFLSVSSELLYFDSVFLGCRQQKKTWLPASCENLLVFACWGHAYLLYSCGNQDNPERSQLSLSQHKYFILFTHCILQRVKHPYRFNNMQCSLYQSIYEILDILFVSTH